jgi:hypothetical protein
MKWIKANYDQFILGLLALVLLGLSGWLIYISLGFQDTFASVKAQVYQNNNVPPIDLSSINDAATSLQNPTSWAPTAGSGSLFVSIPYIISDDGQSLIDPATSPIPIHPPVPNQWLIVNHLDILDGNVLNEDPSGDGFSNLDKWKGVKGDGTDSCNPWDKNSHPPYWTKLRLVQYIKQPFRLLFNAYDGDVKKPGTLEFEINTIDINQPTQFVKVGDTIAGTSFKVTNFAFKSVTDPGTGGTTDVSELTVENVAKGITVTLVLNQVANSPDSYALFRYLWNSTQFQVELNQQFALLPDTNLRYTLVGVTDDGAVVQTPTGDKVNIPVLTQ